MTDADVIVIGGGPSGVAAAIEMSNRGVPRVMLLERESELGGATRHCSHSPFGMREFGRVYFGAAYGRKLELQAEIAGVDVRTGVSVVALGEDGTLKVTSNSGVQTLSASRIMYATGARETPRSARLVSGDRPIGIITTGTLQCYVALHGMMPFRRPIIVGSELVSLSALLTCLSHGARPVAMIESRPHTLARAPMTWFPALVRVPFHRNTEIVDIRGLGRVEAVTLKRGDGTLENLECDGVLLTGQFTPESSLFLMSDLGMNAGSCGPAIDQDGRTRNPIYFAGGNVLRAVETGGWAYREGRAVGACIAEDMQRGITTLDSLPVQIQEPIKLVVPNMLRRSELSQNAFTQFQLRFLQQATGTLSLWMDRREVWKKRATWMPERRLLVPIPDKAQFANSLEFRFTGE